MRTNTQFANASYTHEGGLSTAVLTPAQELRRTVMANMLFEDTFYESGIDVATRIRNLVKVVPFEDLALIAIDAREKMKLRHVPLLVVREALRYHTGRKMGDLIARVIQRPDEAAELLAIYWKDGKNQPLTSQMKIGLARAMKKFSEYQIAKWKAAELCGKAFQVAIAIWFSAGVHKRREVKLSGQAVEDLGVSRYACYRGLKLLEKAGLISVQRAPGRKAIVTILDLTEAANQLPATELLGCHQLRVNRWA